MNKLRDSFPALRQKVNGAPLVYLDSAATALKPQEVVDVIAEFYAHETANVHRGAHYLSDRATQKFENARQAVCDFLCARNANEIVFTKGTTESINLVAQSWGRRFLRAGDEIILSEMEHHSNIVPWQMLAEDLGMKINYIGVSELGELDYAHYKELLNERTKLVSLTHCSNTLGTFNDIEKFISEAKKFGAKTLVDAAQSVTFHEIDVQRLGCDFLAFSGHKLYGPYGVGVLYGREALLNEMPPYQGGGAMISQVTKDKTTYLNAPQRFEAGTPNISGVIGLGAAIEYVTGLDRAKILKHEKELVQRASDQLKSIKGLRFIGESPTRVNILSFVVNGLHPADIGQILDQQGVAVRVGHHCTQPLMARFGVTGTVRTSFGVYNTVEDVDIFVSALKKAQELLA